MNDPEVNKCLEENFNLLSKGILPESYIKKPLDMLYGDIFSVEGNYINWRDKYIENFGFPLYARNWIYPLAKWIGERPCLEVCCGTGHLSYFLSKFGVKIKATDNYSWSNKLHMEKTPIYVENLDAIDAVFKYGKDVKFVILSWPYMDDTAYNVLMTMRLVNPLCKMIYIGEGEGGCTANIKFFENAEFLDVKSFNAAVYNYRKWYGIYDFISLVK